MMPGWFKGMEQIIQECGLLPNGGLLAQCEGFKCEFDQHELLLLKASIHTARYFTEIST